MSFDWKSLVSSVAPVLGMAIGGPFGGVASKAIQTALGVDSDEGIAKELQANPESLFKLKKADQDFDVKMKELDIDVLQIAADDRANARDLQKHTKSVTVPILSLVTVLCFFSMVGWILAGMVTLDSTLLGIIIGVVGTKAEQVYNFYYGSSAGSKDKTAALGKKQ
jgi:hypothetical protein